MVLFLKTDGFFELIPAYTFYNLGVAEKFEIFHRYNKCRLCNSILIHYFKCARLRNVGFC